MYLNFKIVALVIGCISCVNLFKLPSSSLYLLRIIKGTSLKNNTDTQLDNEAYSTIPVCYNKLVSSEGFVQIPVFSHKYPYSTACEWDFNVKEDFFVEFEVELFRLPFNKEESCASYVEISYTNQQNEVVNRRLCPTDFVDRVHTGSETAHILFKSGEYREEYGNHSYGFKINYRAVTASSPAGDKQVVTLVLLSFAILVAMALCVCCICGRNKSAGNTYSVNIIPQEHSSRGLSIRSDLQTSMEVQRFERSAPKIETIYEPFPIFQSKTPSGSNVLSRDLGLRRSAPPLHEKKKISIATTPRSCFPQSIRMWNSENARRLQQVKTRLVSRFSSNSSDETSIYFDVLDYSRYSQLNCEDEYSPEEEPIKEDERPESKSRVVPSIVIQFME